MVCKETGLDALLAELAVHQLDLVIADRPIPPRVSTRGFSHKLGECTVSFFATASLINQFKGPFPECLNGMPILLPSMGNQLRADLGQWFIETRIHPKVVAEFDDSALMKSFGKEGVGVFIAPTVLCSEVEEQYKVKQVGQVDDIKDAFYAITVERRISNVITSTVIGSANNVLSK